MFGILIEGPTNVFCDNFGILLNLIIPESTLQKKHNAINYHQRGCHSWYTEIRKRGRDYELVGSTDEGFDGKKIYWTCVTPLCSSLDLEYGFGLGIGLGVMFPLGYQGLSFEHSTQAVTSWTGEDR